MRPAASGEVHRRPVMVVECTPDAEVVVLGDRPIDLEPAQRVAHVVDVVLEAELGRMGTDYHQTLIAVLGRPRTDIGQRAQPVDAGVGPEIDQDDLAAQALHSQRLGVQPRGGPGEGRERPLVGHAQAVARKPMGQSPDEGRWFSHSRP